MPTSTLKEFEEQALAEGFDEVLERSWPADAQLDTHTHPFALKARVVRGEMWLTVGSKMQHLKEGDDFALDREVAHAERYGHQGATYWVARRN